MKNLMKRLYCVLILMLSVTQTVAFTAYSDHVATHHSHHHNGVGHSHSHIPHENLPEEECPTCQILISASFHSFSIDKNDNSFLVYETLFTRHFTLEAPYVSIGQNYSYRTRAPPAFV